MLLVRRVAVLLLAVPALAGCAKRSSGPPPAKPFSGAEVQRTIDTELPRTLPGLRVGTPRSPGTVEATPEKPGTSSITGEGVPLRIRVDRVDADRFKVSTDQAVIPLAKLEASLVPAVAQKGGQTYSIDCGDEAVKIFDPPAKLTCGATPAKGTPVVLVVTVSDKQGNYTFEQEKDS